MLRERSHRSLDGEDIAPGAGGERLREGFRQVRHFGRSRRVVVLGGEWPPYLPSLPKVYTDYSGAANPGNGKLRARVEVPLAGHLPDPPRRVLPARLDVVAAPLGVLPDPLPCRRLAAVGVLQLVVVDHPEAVARADREGA